MKISYQWLKEFVNFKYSAQELAGKLITLGFGVEGIQPCSWGQDFILEIEITPNRGDCLCILGIVREISAFTGIPFKVPKIKICEDKEPLENFLKVEVEDKILCPRYTARLIKGVKVGPSPLGVSRRLESLGVRSINNIVDATNYAFLERGQPLHAFDYSLIKGRKIVVRRAKPCESIVTLDGLDRILNNNMLVIADTQQPIAIAGIMGGANTEVRNTTTDVIIESAYFHPGNIRKTSQNLGMKTSASYRFERSADINEVRFSLDRVCSLIQEIAGGDILKGVIDEYSNFQKPQEVTLYYSKIAQILGAQLEKRKTIRILKQLGFGVKEGKTFLKIRVPTWRSNDVTREIDVIEEIARLHGYDKVKPALPPINFEGNGRHSSLALADNSLVLQGEVRDIMRDAGFLEVVNSGIVKKGIFERLFSEEGIKLIRIKNPLDEEMDILRPSLIPGLMENLIFNVNRDITSVKIFEIGRIFYGIDGELPEEHIRLAGLITGTAQRFWGETPRKLNFYDLKGILEYLFERLGISVFKFVPGSSFLLKNDLSILIYIRDARAGSMGQLKDEILQFYKLSQEVYFFEIELECVKDFRELEKRYKPFSKFPSIRRDSALLVPVDISAHEVKDLIEKEGGNILTEIFLFDYYQGEQVPLGFKSLAFSFVYQSREKTLTDEEVNVLHFRIIQRLSEKGISLRM
ncbi:phenylalanine--tRNA ligase subunit beta [Candidatus Desantisbacteria bacterium CG1_02_38_46]|uniref:Phenylalanine--tRNA ligase beta subunit n=1 Tax=Candidatus Desantisbacteria bacterium CG1_02_38_46 TaxID=1817893 RepID=A0A1J4SFK9_9BACT|nr:MAG: phenylalanine--tRNA ligase subunit beta [Candidatus Desantisbacteria bacterium CG1_02_38_46]